MTDEDGMTDEDKGPELIDAREVARRLGVDRNTVYRLAEAGDLPAIRVGRLLRFAWPAALEALADRRAYCARPQRLTTVIPGR